MTKKLLETFIENLDKGLSKKMIPHRKEISYLNFGPFVEYTPTMFNFGLQFEKPLITIGNYNTEQEAVIIKTDALGLPAEKELTFGISPDNPHFISTSNHTNPNNPTYIGAHFMPPLSKGEEISQEQLLNFILISMQNPFALFQGTKYEQIIKERIKPGITNLISDN